MKDLNVMLKELELHERFLESGEMEDEITTPKFGEEQNTGKDIEVLAGMMHSSIFTATNVVRMMLGPTNSEKVKLFMGEDDFNRLKDMGKSLEEFIKFVEPYAPGEMEDEPDEEEEEEEPENDDQPDTDDSEDPTEDTTTEVFPAQGIADTIPGLTR